jgi:ribosome-associated toxin RatA of RatAB toxin-antitoxin module
MMRLARGFWLKAWVVALVVVGPATAAPNDEQKRLMKKRGAERYDVAASGSSVRAGAARVTVKAPIKLVHKVVSDFKNYPEFISKFEKARVVGREGNKTDVYLQVPILKGAAKVWAVVRFEPVKSVNGWDVLEAHMVKGNVKRLDAWWRVKKIDDENTQLNLEMLIVPKLPVPGSLITDEVAYAADVAVMGSRNRAERAHAAGQAK